VKELVYRLIKAIHDDDCFGRAAQLAYYFFFALFPFLLFLTTLVGYIPVPNLTDRIMELLVQILPGNASHLVEDNVHELVTVQRGGLLSFGIVAALWTSSSAVAAIINGLNRAYGVEEGRPFWKVRGIAILFTIGFSLFLVVSMVLLTFGPWIGGWIAALVGSGSAFRIAWNLLRWTAILVLLMLAVVILYDFGPSVDQEWRWITPGSAFAVLAWIAASLGFAYYVNKFTSYNAAYGSIGAVIVLLTWMYLTGFFILVGEEINAVIEQRAQKGKAPRAKKRWRAGSPPSSQH
jgi:membrane protein